MDEFDAAFAERIQQSWLDDEAALEEDEEEIEEADEDGAVV